MEPFDETPESPIDEARAALAAAERARADRVHDLAVRRRDVALSRARLGDDDPRTREARKAYDTSLAALKGARAAAASARETLAERLAASLPERIEDELSRLGADLPVVLLPVRLETRFAHGHEDPQLAGSLRVRIYPDAIHADAHEPRLTTNERDAGRDYWRLAWDTADERGAWTALLREVKPTRAAFVVRETEPANLAERPATPATDPPEAGRPEPRFEDPPLRPEQWRSRTEARLLPDRWIVLAYRRYPAESADDVVRAESGPVSEPLALTLRASGDGEEAELADSAALTDDGLEVDPELLWSFDFAHALDAGMAVQIDLSAQDLDHGFARVVALGVKSSLAPGSAADALGLLLDAHRYTRGLAAVPQGTPTNNTTGSPSGYPPPDPDGAASFAAERDPERRIDGRDGERLAMALGVATEHLLHVAGAERDEDALAGAMAAALWPATLGYFLEHLMAPHVSADVLDAVRGHFVDSVRARGPLPAIRVGDVPYAVLPVTSLAAWSPAPGAAALDRELPPLLRRLLPTWTAAANGAPRIGRTGDADRDLVEALSLDASTREAFVRSCLGPSTQRNTLEIFGIDLPSWGDLQDQVEAALLAAAGLPATWAPRVSRLAYGNRAVRFRHGLVTNDPEEPLSETDALVFDYVNWIRNAGPEALRTEQLPAGVEKPAALLYLILRHAYLSEIARGARRILLRSRLLREDELRERELVGIVPAIAAAPRRVTAAGPTEAPPAPPQPPTIWEHLARPVQGVTGGERLGRFLATAPVTESVPETGRLDAYRASLASLEGVAAAELERLFAETLDVCSHRMDAWITSLAWKRLADLRRRRAHGTHLGAFGWIEDLHADPPSERRVVRIGQRELSAAVGGAGGHIHAPSMNHAAAAAVLRSGWLTRGGEAREPYAIDLSSARVRKALWFMDAVREGQPLGAALGYEVERGLHERHAPLELDKLIDDLRNLFPLVANKTTDSGELAESIAARNVVDGLALRRAWQNDQAGRPGGIPWSELAPAPTADERAAIEAELRALDDAADAIADVLTSEAVYQLVQGKTDAAAASLDTMAKGVRPPEPEVVTTPRGGTDVQHRVALVLGGDPPAAPPWDVAERTPRGEVEPFLNRWVGEILGPPGKVVCTVRYPDPADPSAVKEAPLELAALGLEPLDVAAIAGSLAVEGATEFGRRVARGSELHRRIAFAVSDARPDDPIEVELAPSGIAPDERTFAAALEIARAIDGILGRARPLRPADLLAPEHAAKAASADLMADELAGRATLARARLASARDALAGALATVDAAPEGTDPPLAGLRAALSRAALFGVAGAFPASRAGDGPRARAALVTQGGSVLAELGGRQAAATAEADPVAAIEHVFGGAFAVLPRFVPASAGGAAAELDEALAHPPDLGARPADEVARFLAKAARVRAPLADWRLLALYAGTGGRDLAAFDVVQLPHVSGETWVGRPFGTEDRRPPSGRLSLVLHRPAQPLAGAAWAGLMLDEWTERIPHREEDGAVAFHHDSPGAQAPQAVLVAVPPVDAAAVEHGEPQRWSLEALVRVVNETLDLAKVRAVEPERLGILGQVLPMTFLACNVNDDTISTRFGGRLVAEAAIVRTEA